MKNCQQRLINVNKILFKIFLKSSCEQSDWNNLEKDSTINIPDMIVFENHEEG